jgi:ABC-type dipeptide/oligopeptide/nickel transport system ATPase component
LSLSNVEVHYPQKRGVIRGLELDVEAGEVVGLVGQSGFGKSTLALAILGLLDHTGAQVRGDIRILDRAYSARDLRDVRGRIVSLVPQSPAAALNPALRIGAHLREAWRAHSKEHWGSRSSDLLESVGLPADENFLRRFPGQISIGQAQRVLVVMALLHNPALLIADEPTSALDLLTQREILDLIARINADRRMAVLFISHDLAAVAVLCNRLAILHDGVVVECGPAAQVLRAPVHPYTRALVAAIPKLY